MKSFIYKTLILAACLMLLGPALALAEEKDKKENPSEVRETLSGDVMADAMRTALGTDIALLNAGSLGPGNPPAKINKDTLESLVPYPDDLVVAVKLSGEDLLTALEKSVSALPRRFSGLLQVSGVSFTCDLNKKSGMRLAHVKVNGADLDPEAVYTVALTDFLSSGGSGYTSLKNGELIEDEEMTLGDIALKHAVIDDDVRENVGQRIIIVEQIKE